MTNPTPLFLMLRFTVKLWFCPLIIEKVWNLCRYSMVANYCKACHTNVSFLKLNMAPLMSLVPSQRDASWLQGLMTHWPVQTKNSIQRPQESIWRDHWFQQYPSCQILKHPQLCLSQPSLSIIAMMFSFLYDCCYNCSCPHVVSALWLHT